MHFIFLECSCWIISREVFFKNITISQWSWLLSFVWNFVTISDSILELRQHKYSSVSSQWPSTHKNLISSRVSPSECLCWMWLTTLKLSLSVSCCLSLSPAVSLCLLLSQALRQMDRRRDGGRQETDGETCRSSRWRLARLSWQCCINLSKQINTVGPGMCPLSTALSVKSPQNPTAEPRPGFTSLDQTFGIFPCVQLDQKVTSASGHWRVITDILTGLHRLWANCVYRRFTNCSWAHVVTCFIQSSAIFACERPSICYQWTSLPVE